MARIARGLVLALAVSAAIVGAVLIAVVLALRTEPGLAALTRVLERALSEPGEREIAIEAIEGDVLDRFQMRGLSVGDASGTWLTAERVRVAWRPSALWRGRLHVTELDIGAVDVARAPGAAAGPGPVAPAPMHLPLRVVLERLRLARLDLAPSLLGRPVSVEAQGETAATREGSVQLSFTAASLEPAGLRLVVDAGLSRASGELVLDARLTEPGGDLLGRALGRDELGDVSVRLEGAGPPERWRGELTGVAPRLGRLTTTLGASLVAPVRLAATGRFEPSAELAGPAATLSAGGADFEVDVSHAEDGGLLVREARLATASLRASLEGRVGRDALALDGRLRLEETATAALGAPLEPVALAAVDVDIVLTGTLRRPRVALDVLAPGLRAPGAGEAELRASADLVFEGDPRLDTTALSVHATGELRDLALVDPRLAALAPSRRVAWAMTARHQDGRLDVERAELSSEGLRGEAEGSMSLVERGGELRLTLEADDLARLGPLLGTGLQGRGRAQARVRVAAAGGVEAEVDGRLEALSVGGAAIESMLGGALRFETRIARDAGGRWRATGLDVESPRARLTGNLALAPSGSHLTGEYRLVAADLARITSLLDTRVGGRLTVEGTLEGAAVDPSLRATVRLHELTVADRAWGDLSATIAARSLATGARGELDATLDHPTLQSVQAATAFAVSPDGELALDELRARARETELSGHVVIPARGHPLRGALRLEADALSPWAPILGRAVGGKGSASVDLAGEGRRQDARVRIRIESLMLEGANQALVSAGTAEISAALRDLGGEVGGDLEASLRDAAAGELRLERLSLAAHSTGAAAAAFDITAAGALLGELDLTLAGELRREDEATEVRLQRLAGRALGHEVALSRAVALRLAGQAATVRDLELAVGGGSLALDAQSDADTLTMRLELRRLPLSVLHAALPRARLAGAVSGELHVEGPRTAPRARIDLAVDELRETSGIVDELPPLEARLRGRWESGRVHLDASVGGLAGPDLRLQGSVPLRVARAGGPRLELPATGDVSARIHWAGDVGPYWDLLAGAHDRLRGEARLDVRVAGTVGTPRVEGGLELTGGRYENARTGTVLDAVELVVQADEDRLVVSRAHATDGAAGTLRASGSLALDPGRGMPLDVSATMKRFSVIRRDEINALASGELVLRGPLEQPTLAGSLVAERVDAVLVSRLPASVVALDVVEVNRPGGPPERDEPAPRAAARLALDLAVSAPGGVFLRGRGLDSEWRGDLRVAGTAHAPVVEGKLEPVRGQFRFAGKSFVLGTGSVRFPGGNELEPYLDLTATYRAGDIEAIIRATGRAGQPEIDLQSRPPLPDSEIASRVLFGKGSAELTPAQSVQLASAIAGFAGATGDVDLLERTRAALGVDSVQVGEGSTGNGDTTVSVGKYVAPNVYLEVERGVQSGANAAEVQIEVLPNVRLESGVTDQQEGRVGINWRWDY